MKIYSTHIMDFFEGCFDMKKAEKFGEYVGFDFKEFEREFLYRLSKESYWEGDGEVLFFPVFTNSSDGRFDYAAIIKQSNNGSTWVAVEDHVIIFDLEDSRYCDLIRDTKAYKKYYQG
jgi:hypothetical protein